jgi:MscS family membrane protein
MTFCWFPVRWWVGWWLLFSCFSWAETDGGTIDPQSPRAAMTSFFALTSAGDYAQAARFLNQAGFNSKDPGLSARRLSAVLDRNLWIDLELLSPLAEGNLTDGLTPQEEQLGTIPGDGGPEAVVLIKTAESWHFSPATVGQIDRWYSRLESRWVLERVPPMLLKMGPWGLQWWQVLGAVALALASWVLGRLLSRLAKAGLLRLTQRTAASWDDSVVERLAGPATVLFSLAIAWMAMALLGLSPPAEAMVARWLRTGFFVGFFWSLLRGVDVIVSILTHTPWAENKPASISLMPLAGRTLKVGIGVVAVVAVLSEFGYPVASLIAGLGIGGIAVALAGQKTVENLFGAFSLGLDQPFREGDFVKVEDFVGTVEVIGLRSTRIRTLDRTLVTIPNGRLAEMRLESFTARDRIRLATTISLVYGTSAEQMRQVLTRVEEILRSHPKIWPDAVVVRFKELAASALEIEVMAWFITSEWGEFQAIRQELLLQFMNAVESSGTSFAYPTQTLHLVREPKRS